MLMAPKTVIIHAMQSTFSAAMFSVVWTASCVVGKQVPCVRFLRGFWKASYWRHVRKNVMSILHTKSAIDLTKTPFQLHDILSYTGSEITFIRQAPSGHQMENVGAK